MPYERHRSTRRRHRRRANRVEHLSPAQARAAAQRAQQRLTQLRGHPVARRKDTRADPHGLKNANASPHITNRRPQRHRIATKLYISPKPSTTTSRHLDQTRRQQPHSSRCPCRLPQPPSLYPAPRLYVIALRSLLIDPSLLNCCARCPRCVVVLLRCCCVAVQQRCAFSLAQPVVSSRTRWQYVEFFVAAFCVWLRFIASIDCPVVP